MKTGSKEALVLRSPLTIYKLIKRLKNFLSTSRAVLVTCSQHAIPFNWWKLLFVTQGQCSNIQNMFRQWYITSSPKICTKELLHEAKPEPSMCRLRLSCGVR